MRSTILLFVFAVFACNDAADKAPETKPTDTAATAAPAEAPTPPAIKEQTITYTADGVTMKGFVAYDSNNTAKRPAILIVHEWWGLNEYPKTRARELAKQGYVAFAMDMFGNGKVVDNPKDAEKAVTPFYKNPQKAKTRLEAALAAMKELPQTDPAKIAAIGYCFGGGMVLNAARLGTPVNGVVSFHGSLAGVPANKDLLKAKILVCNGEADKFLPAEEITDFRKQMDSIKADYSFKNYPNAMHAFTNPNSTEVGKKFNIPIAYNAEADAASWKDMLEFFDRIFQ